MQKNQVKLFFISPLGRLVIIIPCAAIIVGLIVLGIGSNALVISGLTLLACAIFGWRALNSITPDIFLFMSIGGWAIYFLIKGLLSIFIGAFVAPVQIANSISKAISDSLKEM